MTLGDYQNKITKKLQEAEVSCADYEALQLLIAASGKTRLQLLLDRRFELDPALEQRLEPLLAQRLAGRPLQYILGSTEFMGLEFLVDERVLIPRQDTELTAETAAEWLLARDNGRGLAALDLCTGSGALAVYLKAAFPLLKVTAADISQDALDVAGRNARRNGCSIRFVQSDLFSSIDGVFDLIVTNPPYIPAGDIPGLMREVRDHEPHLALDGGADGLDLMRVILQQAPAHLTAGGLLLMEIGHQQGEAAADLAAQTGAFAQISVKKDLNGLDRMLFCCKI